MTRIEAVRHETEEAVRQVTAEADQRKDQELQSAKDELQARLAEIDGRTDYDALGKTNLTRATTLAGEREQERLQSGLMKSGRSRYRLRVKTAFAHSCSA